MVLINFKYYNCKKFFNNKKYKKIIKNQKKIKNINKIFKNLETLNIIFDNKHTKNIKRLSNFYKNKFDKYCVIGTGGSTLGSQALVGLLKNSNSKNFFFYDNIDPIFFEDDINFHNLKKTFFIIISKSGYTSETLAQLGALLKKYEDLNLHSLISKNFIFITEKNDSPLIYIAKKLNIKILEQNKNIGGRFSVFSNVGLFVASLANLNINSFNNGAKMVLKNALINKYKYPIQGAALSILLNKVDNKKINVLLTYSDALKKFGAWYRQLWSESIGKNNFGITPIHSIGTIDQHSQIQLYLDGPKDKYFTVIKTSHKNKGLVMHNKLFSESGIKYLAGKKMGDLMEAEQKSTTKTLINKKIPVREIFIKKINEKSLGALMMHYMLETISAGEILGINPFNQPAVDKGKILTKKYMK